MPMPTLRWSHDHHRDLRRGHAPDFMACGYPNQDRYLVIAFLLASRKAVHLRAGHSLAPAPLTRSPASSTAAAAFLLFSRPPQPPSPPPPQQLLPSIPATVTVANSP